MLSLLVDDSDDEAYFDLGRSQGMASMESSFSSTITSKSASTVASEYSIIPCLSPYIYVTFEWHAYFCAGTFLKGGPGMAKRQSAPVVTQPKSKTQKQKGVYILFITLEAL